MKRLYRALLRYRDPVTKNISTHFFASLDGKKFYHINRYFKESDYLTLVEILKSLHNIPSPDSGEKKLHNPQNYTRHYLKMHRATIQQLM